ncbi:MAG TPA: hypothetical protein VFW83_03715 [Bryobacteraceae bacterium]|nr:hypothetical protein [Bryobacteraceae bacterium]
MNRKILLLNAALLALAGSLFWLLRIKWTDSNAHERASLDKKIAPRAVIAPPPLPPVKAAKPTDYLDVAQKTLFSADRNPNIVADPPKPPPPPKPLPKLPSYYGQMALGGDAVVLLSLKSDGQKSYAVGDKIGDFKIAAFDHDSITFDWDGKPVVRKLADLAPTEPQQQASPAASAPSKSPVVTNLAKAPAPKASTEPPSLGTDMGGGNRACKAGDTSPAGTVLDGYKKVVSQGLMGQACFWKKEN